MNRTIGLILLFTLIHPLYSQSIDTDSLALAVKLEFLHAWTGYKVNAWGYDGVRPISGKPYNWYKESLLLTPIDAFDTMVLMGLKEEADETKELICSKLSFDKDISVKNFEITIRVLGGLLSAYQLSGDRRFLTLADDLGKRLLPVFNSPTGMPYVNVNLKTGAVSDSISNPAEIGTLLIEFGTLSKLTGNGIYYSKAKQALVAVFNRRSSIGLVGDGINVETGEWVGTDSHIGGGIDSYYEYLFKCWKLFGDTDCLSMWQQSIQAVNKYLADTVKDQLWYGVVNMNTRQRTGTYFGALEAFMPGLLAFSGDIARARALENSCYTMWNMAGIEPEVIDYDSMKIVYPGYPLRPEIIESAFYLHRLTGDEQYLRMGVTFFDSLKKYCRTDYGYAALENVQTKDKRDMMESFFFAETMKYLYLLFADRSVLDLNESVFNTEAHPIRNTWQ